MKFQEFLTSFDTEEQCVNFFMKKLEESRSQALVKAIETFNLNNGVLSAISEEELTKQVMTKYLLEIIEIVTVFW